MGLKVREGGQGREERSLAGDPHSHKRDLRCPAVLLLLGGATDVWQCELHQVSTPLWAQELHLDPEDSRLGRSTFPSSATS